MPDLALFRALDRKDADTEADAQLALALREVAGRSFRRRIAWLARAAWVAQSNRAPALRAAALLVLAGAVGVDARRAIERGLDDDDPVVRDAAITALRALCASEPQRWLIATLHSRPEVRARAAQRGPSAGAELCELPLLAEEAHRDAVIARLQARLDAGTPAAAHALPFLLDAARRRWIAPSVVVRFAQLVGANELTNWLAEQPARPHCDDPREANASAPDALDDLLELEWTRDPSAVAPQHTLWWQLVTTLVDEVMRARLASAAWVLFHRHGFWSDAGVVVLFSFASSCFAHVDTDRDWLPLVAHASAATGAMTIVENRAAARSLTASWALRDAGRAPLDPRTIDRVAAVLFLDPPRCAEHLAALLPRERLIEALCAHPERAALWFLPREQSALRARALLDQVELRDPTAVDRVVTALLSFGGAHGAQLADFASERACLAALLAHAHADPPTPGPRDPRGDLARRIGAPAIAALWSALLAREVPADRPLRWLALALAALPADSAAAMLAADPRAGTAKSRWLLDRMAALVPTCAALRFARDAIDASPAPDETASRDETASPLIAPAEVAPPPALAPARPTEADVGDLSYVDEDTLRTTIEPMLAWPMRGVAAALGERDERSPHVHAAALLLRAADPIEQVTRVLHGFWPDDDEMLEALDALAATRLAPQQDIGLLGHAWLYRWERHALAFASLAHRERSIAAVLRTVDSWPTELAVRAWRAAARAVELGAAREGGRAFDPAQWAGCVSLALDELAAPSHERMRDAALGFLAAIGHSPATRALGEAHLERARSIRAGLDEAHARALRPWLDPPAARPVQRSPEARATHERIRTLRVASAEESAAAARAFDQSEDGRQRLLSALFLDPPSPGFDTIAALVAQWTGPIRGALDEVLARCAPDVHVTVERARFALGESAALDRAIAVAQTSPRRMDPARLDALLTAADAREADVLLALLEATCASTRSWALARTIERADLSSSALSTHQALPSMVEALLSSLDEGEATLAKRAARWLWQRGNDAGFLWLSHEWLSAPSAPPDWLDRATPQHVAALLEAALCAGPAAVPETAVVDLLRSPTIGPAIAAYLWSELLQRARGAETRQAAINELNRVRLYRSSRAAKLKSVARAFAWGVGIGLQLTGRVMSIQLARDQALGYTRLDEERIFVSALPLLRGERYGRTIVEGLILHEFGHHRYHRGVEQRAAWDQGAAEGIGPLLNLVADEHLERNLRALDNEYGDRLKKLTAYAFQHMDRAVAIRTLFQVLRGSMLEVLSSAGVRFAMDEENVIVEHGRLLQSLERSGSSFARFVRALRMGLGDRHGDDKVSRALALFSGTTFRKSTMAELLEIARQVRAIFGDECGLLQVCSTHEDVGQGEAGDVERNADGISDEELRREVDRIVNPRRSEDDGMSAARPGGKRWINVTEQTDFDLITEVVRVRYEGAHHRALAQRVRRSAQTLRGYLERLGLHLQPERLRLRGRRVDAPRTRALVTRGDPRVLVAREIQVKTDLFIGVVIDCSGSMSGGENMPRARLFGALIAEAARAMPSVDVRIFGFTDRVIYDAGDARAPAVHALEAGGGNNDAGALWHAANVARASRRRAKLLVMISDGMPTECSSASLKHLAIELTRRHKMCCAQIAVQPLPEVLFPHYVEVDGPDTDAVVRRFGRIVEGLIKHAMGIP